MASRLPYDVIHHVVNLLNRNDLKTLVAVALVNSEWSRPAMARLWERPFAAVLGVDLRQLVPLLLGSLSDDAKAHLLKFKEAPLAKPSRNYAKYLREIFIVDLVAAVVDWTVPLPIGTRRERKQLYTNINNLAKNPHMKVIAGVFDVLLKHIVVSAYKIELLIVELTMPPEFLSATSMSSILETANLAHLKSVRIYDNGNGNWIFDSALRRTRWMHSINLAWEFNRITDSRAASSAYQLITSQQHLRRLELRDWWPQRSVNLFNDPAVRNTLTCLELHTCNLGEILDFWRQLAGLQNISHLSLINCSGLREPVDMADMALPHLRIFEFADDSSTTDVSGPQWESLARIILSLLHKLGNELRDLKFRIPRETLTWLNSRAQDTCRRLAKLSVTFWSVDELDAVLKSPFVQGIDTLILRTFDTQFHWKARYTDWLKNSRVTCHLLKVDSIFDATRKQHARMISACANIAKEFSWVSLSNSKNAQEHLAGRTKQKVKSWTITTVSGFEYWGVIDNYSVYLHHIKFGD